MPYFQSSRWPQLVALDRLDVAQARVAGHQPAAEPLEVDRVFDGQAEVPQLDLAVRARERERAGDGAAVVILRRSVGARRSSLSA